MTFLLPMLYISLFELFSSYEEVIEYIKRHKVGVKTNDNVIPFYELFSQLLSS